MRTRILAVTAVLAAVACGAFAGCGDDESSTSAAAGGTTKAQFLEQANALCMEERKKVFAEVEAFMQDVPPNRDPEELRAEGVQQVLLPIFETEIERLEELDLPEGDEERVGEMLNAQQAAIDRVAGFERIEPIEDGFEKYFNDVKNEMDAYGLDQCAVR